MTNKKPIRWEHPQQMVRRLHRQRRLVQRQHLWLRARQLLRTLAGLWQAMRVLLEPPRPRPARLTVTAIGRRSAGDLAA